MEQKVKERDKKRIDTDERILEAAVEVFGANGFEGTTIREIAKKAGVTAGLVSQRFESKVNLMIRALDHIHRYQEPFRQEDLQMPNIIYRMAEEQMRMSQLHPHIFAFMTVLSKGIGIPEEVEEYRRQMFHRGPISGAIRRAQEQGNMPEGDPYGYYCIFLSNMGNLMFNYMKYGLPLPPKEHFLHSIQYTYDALKQHEQAEQDRIDFAQAVGAVYPTVIYANLTRDTMRFAISTGESTPEIPTAVAMGNFLSTFPSLEERETFRELFGRKNLMEVYQQGERVVTYRHRQRSGNGTIHWKETMVVLSESRQGEVNGVILIRNIDREVQAQEQLERAKEKAEKAIEASERSREEAEKANRAKTSFLFNMSHDIRTPMNAIIGYTELLELHDADPEKRAAYRENIRISGEYLLELINEILEVSRIESGKISLDEELTDLRELQNSVAVVFTNNYKKKKLHVEREYEFSYPYVFCDATKCRQILLNVISNAVKYTPEGGRIFMSVRERPSEREGYVDLEFVVEDNGIGMSEEFLPHLFDSFSREKTVTENKIVGSGLGMGIVKRLTDLMQGTVHVTSELGKGTRVVIYIPMRVASQDISEQVVAADIQITDIRGVRVLLAEDNEMNREIAEDLLAEQGIQVDSVEDGIECVAAWERAKEDAYDVILMDIQMPNMNGYQAAERIRYMQGAKGRIPIIAMTANVFDEDRKRAKEAGMDGFAGKPIDMNVLSKEILRVLTQEIS